MEESFFTRNELFAIAARHRFSSLDELSRRWVIQSGKNFYVMGPDGNYKSPIMHSELATSLQRDLKRVPPKTQEDTCGITWKKMKGETLVNRPVDEILAEHCGHARHIYASLHLEHSVFDAKEETFYEAAAPLALVQPVYHPAIATWLQLLAGPREGKLLDWLATLTRLDRPSCALLITGGPSAGKEMLAQGLARRWRRSKGPTELRRIINDFNEDLTRCPLVFCDESLPPAKNGKKSVLGDLRDMIATTSRTLSRKFLSNTNLEGSIRLILAANNNRMLESHEEHTSDDQKAISMRFMHILTDSKPAEYLESIGGRNTTEAWVAGGQIAEHVVWLEQNRAVVPGNRFVVTGDAVDIQKQLLITNKYTSLVLEWLVRHITSEGTSNAALLIGNGAVRVNSSAISTNWSQHVRSDFVPSMHRIGGALRSLALAEDREEWEERGKKREIRYHNIDVKCLCEWSTQNQVGDPDTLLAAINKPLDLAKMKREAAGSPGSMNGNGHGGTPPGFSSPPAAPDGSPDLFPGSGGGHSLLDS